VTLTVRERRLVEKTAKTLLGRFLLMVWMAGYAAGIEAARQPAPSVPVRTRAARSEV
jgi:hypothetical protein